MADIRQGEGHKDYGPGSLEKPRLTAREQLTLLLWQAAKDFAYWADDTRPLLCGTRDREQFIPQIAERIRELFPQVLHFHQTVALNGKGKWVHSPTYVGGERRKLDQIFKELGLSSLPLQIEER